MSCAKHPPSPKSAPACPGCLSELQRERAAILTGVMRIYTLADGSDGYLYTRLGAIREAARLLLKGDA
jgi:hypothetical protein